MSEFTRRRQAKRQRRCHGPRHASRRRQKHTGGGHDRRRLADRLVDQGRAGRPTGPCSRWPNRSRPPRDLTIALLFDHRFTQLTSAAFDSRSPTATPVASPIAGRSRGHSDRPEPDRTAEQHKRRSRPLSDHRAELADRTSRDRELASRAEHADDAGAGRTRPPTIAADHRRIIAANISSPASRRAGRARGLAGGCRRRDRNRLTLGALARVAGQSASRPRDDESPMGGILRPRIGAHD